MICALWNTHISYILKGDYRIVRWKDNVYCVAKIPLCKRKFPQSKEIQNYVIYPITNISNSRPVGPIWPTMGPDPARRATPEMVIDCPPLALAYPSSARCPPRCMHRRWGVCKGRWCPATATAHQPLGHSTAHPGILQPT